MPEPKKVFVLSGEASGDSHLAHLLEELVRRHGAIEVRGLAGPATAALIADATLAPGSAVEDWIEDAAVVGLAEVLRHYPWFKQKFTQALAEIRRWQPELVLLVDYPGFNLRLAKAIRHDSVLTKIAYYISPQVWAWNRRRIPQMARLLDRMLCIFPFEEALYEQSGLKTSFVGHPLVDDLAEARAMPPPRDPELVALLPGSRRREIQRIFPILLDAAAQLRELHPDRPLRFATAARSERTAAALRELATAHARRSGVELPLRISLGNARELMQTAQVGAVASGTATLEAACLGLPYCLVYQVSCPTYLIGRMVVRVDYLGIVNVLAGREVVKEFVQADARAETIAAELDALLTDPAKRDRLQGELAAVSTSLGSGGAARNAAREIAALLARD